MARPNRVTPLKWRVGDVSNSTYRVFCSTRIRLNCPTSHRSFLDTVKHYWRAGRWHKRDSVISAVSDKERYHELVESGRLLGASKLLLNHEKHLPIRRLDSTWTSLGRCHFRLDRESQAKISESSRIVTLGDRLYHEQWRNDLGQTDLGSIMHGTLFKASCLANNVGFARILTSSAHSFGPADGRSFRMSCWAGR